MSKICPPVGKPVNVTNGNMYLGQTDYDLSGIGANIRIRRTYNSQATEAGMFGFGWTTAYDQKLKFSNSDNIATLIFSNRRVAYFIATGGVLSITPATPQVFGQLTKNTDNTYVWTEKDGSSRKFLINGQLLWQRDRHGNQTTLGYSGGKLTTITEPFGRVLTLSYANGSDYVTQIADSLGTVANYAYNTDNTLQNVTYPDGSQYKFEYTTLTVGGVTRPYLTVVRDALNNILEKHDYDALGRAITSEVDGGQEKYTLDYTHIDDAAPSTTVTDGRQNVTTYYFDKSKGRNVVTKTNGVCSCGGGSEMTVFEYDDKLNLKKKTDAIGRTTEFTYDANGNPLTQSDYLGNQSFTYNNFGQILTATDRLSGITTLTYDANGNLKTIKDALDNLTTINYPATNNKGLPDSIKDARQNLTKFKWFVNSGLLQEIEDANLKKTNFTYDARARIKTVTNALQYLTQYNYFDDSQRKVEMIYPNLDKVTYRYNIRRLLESVTDERGKITAYEYDGARRLKKITDPLTHIQEFGYDLMSNLSSVKDGLGNETNYGYDEFNRLIKVEYPVPAVGATRLFETAAYDATGRLKKRIDTAGRINLLAYDDANRKMTLTDADGKPTQITYNQRGQTVAIKDALNQIYTFVPDALGRVLSQTRAGATTSYEFDEVGNRKKRTDYTGRVTDYTYDNLNRLAKIEYDGGAGNPTPKAQSTYIYDELSRLVAATNEAGMVTFNYDNRNRLESTTDVFGQIVGYEYEYDANINQTRLKLNGTLHAKYNFDDAGRLSNIFDAENSTNINFGYDNANRLTTETLPNNVSTTYDYDGMTRLKRLKTVNMAGTIYDREYIYNAASQITQIIEPSETRTFGYDVTDRLKTVTNTLPNLNEFYNFDEVGNRTSSSLSNSYGYQPNNRLTTTQTASYNYDANGSQVSKGESGKRWSYTWDYENRLTQAWDTKRSRVRYSYDALGRRVMRNTYAKGTTKFTYDGADVIQDNDDGTITKYQNGLGIDNKLKLSSGGVSRYFVQDHLGSTNALTDASGNVTEATSYDSFGNASNPLSTRYQFTGREKDSLTGLQYSRARYYSSELGRFISEDPLGFGGGINTFAYVSNHPLLKRDPRGLYENQNYGGCVAGYGAAGTAVGGVGGGILGFLGGPFAEITVPGGAVGGGLIGGPISAGIGSYACGSPPPFFPNAPSLRVSPKSSRAV